MRKQLETIDDYYYQALSMVVTRLRDRSGRSIDDVAMIVDLKKTTYYRYENGSRAMPITIFKKLCVLYNVDMKTTIEEIGKIASEMMEGKR